MAQGRPMPGEKYLHFKNRLYQVIAVAKHSETMEPYVVYQALYGDFSVYIRPYEMFISEVDHEKYPLASQKYRFTYVEPRAEQTDSGEIQCEPEHMTQESEVQSVSSQKEEENEDIREYPGCGESAENRKKSICGGNASAEEKSSVPEMEQTASDGEEQINPWLLRFLDAESMEEKYKVACDIKTDITDRLIDDLAVAVDVVIPEGKLSDRYDQLKYCIRTRQKYEKAFR